MSSGVTAFFHRWYNVAPQRWNLVEYKDFEIYACTFTYPWQHNREWSCLYFLKLIILICKNNKQEFCKWLDKSLKFRNNYYIFNILYLFCIYFIYEGVLFNLLDLLLKLIIYKSHRDWDSINSDQSVSCTVISPIISTTNNFWTCQQNGLIPLETLEYKRFHYVALLVGTFQLSPCKMVSKRQQEEDVNISHIC